MKYLGMLFGIILVIAGYYFMGSEDRAIQTKKDNNHRLVFEDIAFKANKENPELEMLWLYGKIIENDKVIELLQLNESESGLRLADEYRNKARKYNAPSAMVHDALSMFDIRNVNETKKALEDGDDEHIKEKLDKLIGVLKHQCMTAYNEYSSYPYFDNLSFDENNQIQYEYKHLIPYKWDKPDIMVNNTELQRKIDVIKLRLMTYCHTDLPSFSQTYIDGLPAAGIKKGSTPHDYAYYSVKAEILDKPKVVHLLASDIPNEHKNEFFEMRSTLWKSYQEAFGSQTLSK